MKTIHLLALQLLLLLPLHLKAQQFEIISSIALTVSCEKTSHIIFPYPVKSMDVGSKYLLAQKVPGMENILQLKGAGENFPETNLSVVTADGKFYSFLVNFSNCPLLLNIRMQKGGVSGQEGTIPVPHFSGQATSPIQMESKMKRIAAAKRGVHGIRSHSYGVKLLLTGLYVDEDVIYFELETNNTTRINYEVELLDFYMKDRVTGKRTAVQELEQIPLGIYQEPVTVAGLTCHTMVVAFSKFTLPEKKYLEIRMMEKNGGRNLSLQLGNSTLIKAKAVPAIGE